MSAAWRAAVAAAARAPLRGRLAGMRSSRSQRRPSAWGAAAAAALVGGGCLVACYSGRPRVFPTVLAQLKDKRRESRQLQTPDIISSNSSRITE